MPPSPASPPPRLPATAVWWAAPSESLLTHTAPPPGAESQPPQMFSVCCSSAALPRSGKGRPVPLRRSTVDDRVSSVENGTPCRRSSSGKSASPAKNLFFPTPPCETTHSVSDSTSRQILNLRWRPTMCPSKGAEPPRWPPAARRAGGPRPPPRSAERPSPGRCSGSRRSW